MSYYGFRLFPEFIVFRTLLPANQLISFPKIDGDVIYRENDNSSVTFVEGTSNTDLVGVSLLPNTIYSPRETLGEGSCLLQVGNYNASSITVKVDDISTQLTNKQLVEVSGSYNLPVDTYAVVVEGSFVVQNDNSETTINAEDDLYAFGKRSTNFVVNGNGKLLTFNIEFIQ